MDKLEGENLKSERVTYDPLTMPKVACIMHPPVESVTQVSSDKTTITPGTIYGLCSKCTAKLRVMPVYQETINQEIDRHLLAMKGIK